MDDGAESAPSSFTPLADLPAIVAVAAAAVGAVVARRIACESEALLLRTGKEADKLIGKPMRGGEGARSSGNDRRGLRGEIARARRLDALSSPRLPA